jgi:hypothetical protein
MSIVDWFENVVEWGSTQADNVVEWFSGFGDWFSGILGDEDPNVVGLTFLFVLGMAFFLIADPVGVGMNETPLLARLLAVVGFAPICFFIIKRILN